MHWWRPLRTLHELRIFRYTWTVGTANYSAYRHLRWGGRIFGWGGRTSDKHIVEKSGLLNNLLPGDILMADRGFKISDDVAFYQARLVIPDFTKGKKQLHPLEVENTRKIANVRIHVERVIGLVVRKFRIFDGEIPLEFLKLKQGETTPTIDKVVRVCCALSCLCPSVVPFE